MFLIFSPRGPVVDRAALCSSEPGFDANPRNCLAVTYNDKQSPEDVSTANSGHVITVDKMTYTHRSNR
jgi:hypothetical protein